MGLTGAARLAGVMGWPVAHSLSPRLHGLWLDRYGIDGAYVPLAVHPDRFAEAFRGLVALGFRGANVTIPHKEQAFALCDRLTGRARAIGAVNTLVIGEDGLVTGDNTDAFGFIENLRTDAQATGAFEGPALVLGAGGASRAVVHGLLAEGVPEVRLANRTRARSETLAEVFGQCVRVVDWPVPHAACADVRLAVNTTSLGLGGGDMAPLLDVLPALPAEALVTDIVYKPRITPFLLAARARGHRIVDGLGMLLHQARPGFEAWFGTAPEVTADIRAAILSDLGETSA
ncbi:shikimate dehydrogenase [Futiania mangrovi]|uniref:Shikimate dehydrogenase (NADP(+)) n=1 Tax=Futiania mangrovi TaxID=2959716 RepID=A0A9J6PDP5_9PROT|nr:shikimate dehydrogenase [Futiania mangrovii]MCP1336494.1 shikimate dehydrogenase [Futiania mangrovii]